MPEVQQSGESFCVVSSLSCTAPLMISAVSDDKWFDARDNRVVIEAFDVESELEMFYDSEPQ